jgi:hypothetical protein
LLGGSLIIAIGAQNAFILRQGLAQAARVHPVPDLRAVGCIADRARCGGARRDHFRLEMLIRAVTLGGAAFLAVYAFLALKRAISPSGLEAAKSGAGIAEGGGADLPRLHLPQSACLSRQPIDPNNVRMYVCGPTVYDFAHIGNARPGDRVRRAVPAAAPCLWADHVTYVRNITDVDDKINARALRDYPDLPLNEAIARVTEKTTAQYQADLAALGCLSRRMSRAPPRTSPA